jgi:hypothetical protein
MKNLIKMNYKKSVSGPSQIHKQYSKIISDNYANTNIFQGENEYRLLKTLSFDQEEKNCKRNVLMRFIEILTVLIIYCVIRNVYYFFTEWGIVYRFFSLFRIPAVIFLVLNFMSISNEDNFINNSYYVRWFLEMDNLLNILLSLMKISSIGSTPSTAAISIYFVLGFFYNFVFTLHLEEFIVFYAIELITILSFLNHPDNFFLIRILKNFNTKQSIYLALVVISLLITQYYLAKAIRELWALYDSFKRSYFTMKNIYDDFPYPVFIFNSKRNKEVQSNGLFNYQMYYKNAEADKTYTQLRQTRDRNILPKRLQSKIDFNFKDLFEKSVEKLLDN